jgi:hypothetical protein
LLSWDRNNKAPAPYLSGPVLRGPRRAKETEGEKIEYIDWVPDPILQFIDLPTEVMPESAVVEPQAGLLKFVLRKAAERRVETAVTAACIALPGVWVT